jgi:Ser/Thr protein kinase RdoA (MazF antagonist)
LQTKILLHVAEAAPHLPVQRMVQSNDGAFQLRAALRDGTTRTVRLVTCLQGASLHRVRPSSAQRAAIGNVLAELDLALANFAHESADRTLLWNVSEAMNISDRLVFIADPNTQELARAALECFNSEALPVLNTLPRQVIHCDFNPHNILVDEGDHERISGVLDFGDALMAPRVNDVAIAASYHLAAGDGSLTAAADLISGYHARNPLSETELDSLPLLIGARVAMTAAITSWRAELYPEKRDYILRNASLARSGLCALAAISPADARAVLHAACKEARHAAS